MALSTVPRFLAIQMLLLRASGPRSENRRIDVGNSGQQRRAAFLCPSKRKMCRTSGGVEKAVNISCLGFMRESNLTLDEIRDGKTESESWGENRSMTLSGSPLCFAGACFSDFISF
jgi:hypothetical protein